MACTCSYSGDPSDSDKDKVRFLLGDTDMSGGCRLCDEEIEYLLETHETPERAAYYGALTLVTKYAGKMTKAVGSVRIEYGELFNHYQELAKALAGTFGIAIGAAKAAAPWANDNALAPPLPLSDVNWHPGQPEYARKDDR